jgi:hypothetical protein
VNRRPEWGTHLLGAVAALACAVGGGWSVEDSMPKKCKEYEATLMC